MDSSAADFAHADAGIVCALPMELAPLLKQCDRARSYSGGEFTFRGGRLGETRIAVVETGMGFAPARRATRALIDGHTPDWILSCGFSGALQEDMAVGDIVVATSIADTHDHRLDVDVRMPPRQGLHVGCFVTADELVRTVEAKRSLASSTNAIAVDLESMAVAQVAREANLRFLAIRSISDDLSRDLPPEILSVVGDTGSLRLGAAAGAVWKRPGSIKELWRLRENALTAAEKLTDFLRGVIVRLFE